MSWRIGVVAVCAGLLVGVAGCAKSTPPDEESKPAAGGEKQNQAPEAESKGEQPAEKKSATSEESAGGFGGGVQVGEQAPEFTLRDQEGNERTLEGLLLDGPVALVFYRSADW